MTSADNMNNSVTDHPATGLFQSVIDRDYDGLHRLYAANARNSVVSYLSMKSQWTQRQENYTKSEEKLDEFLHQFQNEGSDDPFQRLTPISASRVDNDTSFHHLCHELSEIVAPDKATTGSGNSKRPVKPVIAQDADRLAWEASSVLSDMKPPSDLCVYNKLGATEPAKGGEQCPPIFDGSVANSTPPPLGGMSSGASGGAGTILHLACAMDSSLVLAFLLTMGADGRASHTAFRRLMIHEAACNGSFNCLTLLLEMGQKFAKNSETDQSSGKSGMPFFPTTLELPSITSLTGTSAQGRHPIPPLSINFRQMRRERSRVVERQGDFLSALQTFKSLSESVSSGEMTELEAGRMMLRKATLSESTQASLIRSCAFKQDVIANRTLLRPQGCADGHGNTPLHWAAFKNERDCVSLLLSYQANPNARAHPSGWTPLHDAAYSNSRESIELLIDHGAMVDARANSGATPLCFAAQEDAAKAAHLLLERGADLTARCASAPEDSNGATPIHHPHSRFSGYTPLHYCAHYNAHKASKVLLAHTMAKAAMETPDLSGRLPIHVAVARGSSDVLRELLHAGARIDIRPSNGSPSTSPRPTAGPNAFFALPDAVTLRRPPSPDPPSSPTRNPVRSRSSSTSSPVTSPILRSMIPQEPVTSSKPWNCLSQQAIDECRDLISKAEQSWSPDRHLLFTPQDRKAVMELLRVGKRLEQQGVLFVDLWPEVLSFCGRGWFEPTAMQPRAIDFNSQDQNDTPFDEAESEDRAIVPLSRNRTS